jgi:hypothetical protein
MDAVINSIPADRQIDQNLKTVLEKQIATYLEGINANGGSFRIPNLKYNGVNYDVTFTVIRIINNQTFEVDLTAIR